MIEDEFGNHTSIKQKECVVGEYVFLVDQMKYALVKSRVGEDDPVYECKIIDPKQPGVEDIQMLQMLSMDQPVEDGFTRWTNTVNINVRSILSEDKKQMVMLKLNVNDKAMVIAEQIADLFGETKYSISFFFNA